MSEQPKSQELTSTAPITWDNGIPVIDVVQVHANSGVSHSILFQAMHNCSARLKGRAYGKISDLTITMFSDPEYAVTGACGIVPTNAGTSSAPTTRAEVIACGGVLFRASPMISQVSGTPKFLPGVSEILKGETVALLAGSPPTLYFHATAAHMKDWSLPTYTASTLRTSTGGTVSGSSAKGTIVYFQVSYTLSLSGYDWIKPF